MGALGLRGFGALGLDLLQCRTGIHKPCRLVGLTGGAAESSKTVPGYSLTTA